MLSNDPCKPNKENIRRWVEALRSGKYKQGRQRLRREDDYYCCLGVACDVSGLGYWDDGYNYVVKMQDSDGEMYDMFATYELPLPVMYWLGFAGTNPQFKINQADYSRYPALNMYGNFVRAIAMNDRLEWDFNKIADVIEGTFLQDGQ